MQCGRECFPAGIELSHSYANGFNSPYVGAGIVWAVLQSVHTSGNSSWVTNSTIADMIVEICYILLANVHRTSDMQYGIFSEYIQDLL